MVAVSICISTYSGGPRLEALFKSLEEAGVKPCDELLVYDDGSPSDKAAAIRRAVNRACVTAKALVRDVCNKGVYTGLATIVKNATREVILLLDDDVTLPPGFMGILRGLAAGLGPNMGALSWRSYGAGEYDSSRPVLGFLEPATHLAGYCMAFRRAVYERVGGFDARFERYCGDSDLSLRMTLMGHPSYRVWWPLVSHAGGASARDSPELIRPQDSAALDLLRWLEKYGGKDGPAMEAEALAGFIAGAEE